MSNYPDTSIESEYERGLREQVKADYSEFAVQHPMEGKFRAVSEHATNLENVIHLREQYPEEYNARMTASAIRPVLPENGRLDSGYFNGTFAGMILKGLFDSDHVEYVKQHLSPDRLGIPPEFLDLPEIQKFMRTLANRPWANREVSDFLRGIFNIPPNESGQKLEQTRVDNAQFG